MRKSTLYLVTIAIGFLLLSLTIRFHPLLSQRETTRRLKAERGLVAQLGLTDLCLFTEASYTRHPNLADRFEPFRDHPMAASHFPSESLITPPRHLTQNRRVPAGGLTP